MPLPDRTCAVIQLRTSGWFHSPVAMDKIPSYPVTLLPCIATSLRAWRPHSSLKARTERWTERTLITIIAQLHPRQSLLCRLSLLCSTALRTIVMTRADSSSLESTKVRIRHEGRQLTTTRATTTTTTRADNDKTSQHSHTRIISCCTRLFTLCRRYQFHSPFSHESIHSLMHEHLIKSNMLHIKDRYKETV